MSVTLNSSGITYSDGTSDSDAYTNQFTSSKSANGYVQLPNGIIFQWGSTTGGTTTFPLAFPTACTSLTMGQYNTGSGNISRAVSITRTNYNAAYDACCAPTASNQYYIAIGY